MSKCADSKKHLQKKERKGHWPGISPPGGGSGQRGKDPEGQDDKTEGFDMGLILSLPDHWKALERLLPKEKGCNEKKHGSQGNDPFSLFVQGWHTFCLFVLMESESSTQR